MLGPGSSLMSSGTILTPRKENGTDKILLGLWFRDHLALEVEYSCPTL